MNETEIDERFDRIYRTLPSATLRFLRRSVVREVELARRNQNPIGIRFCSGRLEAIDRILEERGRSRSAG